VAVLPLRERLPVPPGEANLAAIPALAAICGTVGYSDHVVGKRCEPRPRWRSVPGSSRSTSRSITSFRIYRDHQFRPPLMRCAI